MKAFACGDVVPGCDARWVCDTDEEVFSAVQQHAVDIHHVPVLSEELVDAVRRNIVPVA